MRLVAQLDAAQVVKLANEWRNQVVVGFDYGKKAFRALGHFAKEAEGNQEQSVGIQVSGLGGLVFGALGSGPGSWNRDQSSGGNGLDGEVNAFSHLLEIDHCLNRDQGAQGLKDKYRSRVSLREI